VIIFVVYFILWLPTISVISNSVWKTRMMLTMIPLNIIAHIKSVKRFVK